MNFDSSSILPSSYLNSARMVWLRSTLLLDIHFWFKQRITTCFLNINESEIHYLLSSFSRLWGPVQPHITEAYFWTEWIGLGPSDHLLWSNAWYTRYPTSPMTAIPKQKQRRKIAEIQNFLQRNRYTNGNLTIKRFMLCTLCTLKKDDQQAKRKLSIQR